METDSTGSSFHRNYYYKKSTHPASASQIAYVNNDGVKYTLSATAAGRAEARLAPRLQKNTRMRLSGVAKRR